MSGMALVLLGGNAGQALLAEVARDMGFRTILFDRAESPPAAAVVDRFERIDIARADLIVPRVAALAEEYDIRACSGVSDAAFAAIGEIYDAFGIVQSAARETYARMVDKAICRGCLEAAGVAVPKGRIGSTTESRSDLIDAARTDLRFPVIIKPLSGCSGRGVTMIHDPKEELAAVVSETDHPFLLEEAITGRHFNVDGLVVNGAYHGIIIVERIFNDERAAQCDLSIHPADISEARVEELFALGSRVVRALGIECGPVTLDIIVDDLGKPFVLEASPHFHNPVSTAEVDGGSALKAWLAVLDGDLQWQRYLAGGLSGSAALWRVFAPRSGTVESYTGCELIPAEADSWLVEMRRRPGERVENTREHVDLCALVRVGAVDHRRLQSALEKARQQFHVCVGA